MALGEDCVGRGMTLTGSPFSSESAFCTSSRDTKPPCCRYHMNDKPSMYSSSPGVLPIFSAAVSHLPTLYFTHMDFLHFQNPLSQVFPPPPPPLASLNSCLIFLNTAAISLSFFSASPRFLWRWSGWALAPRWRWKMSFLDSWVIDRERMMSFSRNAFYTCRPSISPSFPESKKYFTSSSNSAR